MQAPLGRGTTSSVTSGVGAPAGSTGGDWSSRTSSKGGSTRQGSDREEAVRQETGVVADVV
jgi:hypothetical protein